MASTRPAGEENGRLLLPSDQVTGNCVCPSNSAQEGALEADFFGERAFRKKSAGGRSGRGGRSRVPNLWGWSGTPNARCQQRLSVGMLGLAKEGTCGSKLNQLSRKHDCDTIRAVSHRLQVVRDEQDRKSAAAAQLCQELDDLHLQGGIQVGKRLIANQEARRTGQSLRDGNALALPAGEFVRITRSAIRADPNFLQEFRHTPTQIEWGEARFA